MLNYTPKVAEFVMGQTDMFDIGNEVLEPGAKFFKADISPQARLSLTIIGYNVVEGTDIHGQASGWAFSRGRPVVRLRSLACRMDPVLEAFILPR
jgi:hypothetical protein